MSTAEELLAAHLPYLRYDSQEAYFADSAATLTDSPGDSLKRSDGTVLATAGVDLTLAFLGQSPYPDHPDVEATKTDVLSIPDKHYRERAAALHAKPQYRNVVYGHAMTDGGGSRWLQYWYFYFYNDYNLVGHLIHAGLHEGDWETVHLRLGADDGVDYAVYHQHRHAAGRPWDQVERVPGTERPVVYVARGSHAAYFEPGTKWTGVWFDHADGKRQSPERQRLEVVADGDPAYAWMTWPGKWGDTPPHGGIAPADSPISPGTRDVWTDPLAPIRAAAAAPAGPLPPRPVPPAAPTVTATWTDGGAVLSYALAATPEAGAPAALTITLNSKDEAGVPPRTWNVALDGDAGRIELPGLDPAKRYDIYVSVADRDALASESVRIDLLPPG